MSRFTEKFESIDVGSKNGPFKQNKIFFPDKGVPSLFSVY